MRSKMCFKCLEVKPLSSFYKHSAMADGHVNKCKECNKADVRENRKAKIAHYREYDRQRGNRQTPEYVKEYRENNPEKWAAHIALNNAIRSGKVIKSPCVICGNERTYGHHDNYFRPLDVVWLCAAHHQERHQSLDRVIEA